MRKKLKKFDPAVDKRVLIALSGSTWSFVGIILCDLALQWLSVSSGHNAIRLGIAGVIMALLIHHFGFLKIVNKNIDRILAKGDRVCIFAFQPWKSYLLVIIMISLGIFLRSSSLPKQYLSIIYTGFGGAMILSSFRYHRIFFKLLMNPKRR